MIFLFAAKLCFGQKADSTKAFRYALRTEIVMYSATMYALNDLWYKDYPRSSFHWYNDNSNWLQMDKIGHATTAYSVGLQGRDLMLWAGVPEKKALWFGGLYGSFFLTTIEILDGFSEEWGASWGDLIANTSGTMLFIGQELLFKEQRVQMKYSFATTDYAKQNPDLLGKNFIQQSLKDYNGQVYWLSFNINSFKKTTLPDWLNFAIGYGADGMLNGNADEINTKREYYISLDVNLRKIKTNSRFLNKTLKILSFIKVPLPAFKLSNEKIDFYPIHYGQ
jgi:hypothetical protein